MKFLKYLKYLIFILPLGLAILNFVYNDTTYLLIAGITLILGIFVVIPNKISNKRLSVKINKKSLSTKKIKISLNVKPNEIVKSLKGNEEILFLLVSTLLFLVLFTYIGSYLLQMIPSIHNLFIEYYASQILSLRQTWLFIALLGLALALAGSSLKFVSFQEKPKFKFNRNKFTKRLFVTSGTLILAFVLSFLTTFLFALIQLNLAVVTLQVTPNAVGVLYDKTAINNKLNSMKTVPQIIGSDTNTSNIVLSILINGSANPTSYYQNKVIKSIPHSLVLPFSINNQPVILVNNTLVIASINKDVMKTISPNIARLLLQAYFPHRILKSNPNTLILSRQEYLAYRQNQIDQQVQTIDGYIQKTQTYIGQVESDISLSRQKISINESGLQETEGYKTNAYNYCMSEGYYDYFSGMFYHYYDQSQCTDQASQYDSTIAQWQKNINDWTNELNTDEGYLSDAQNALKEFQTARDATDSQKNTTPDELGLFTPSNTVRVVLDSTNPKGIDDFLETLVHESLHYQSYISKDRQFQFSDGSYDGFWEEGLTEYFARKVVSKELGVNVNQGYPLLVRIVAQVTRKIPESTLEEIYFDKDNSTLQAVLDSAYGANFYKDTEPYFEYISVLPDAQQLKYANDIMTRIGGKQLTVSDLYSTDLQPQ